MLWLDSVGRDVTYGWRLIRKSPLVSFATVATLAVGIGLDAGVFTVINGVLFRPRVAHKPETFVEVRQRANRASLHDYETFRAARSLQELAAWSPVPTILDPASGAARGSQHVALLVSCNFFAVFGPERPIIGRGLSPADCATPGASPVVVIGEDLWRTKFGARDDVVGTSLTLNGAPFTIVGVMPSGYDGQLRGPIWLPYTMASTMFGGRDLFAEPATAWLLGLTGRLRPGVSRAEAGAELAILDERRNTARPGEPSTVRVTDGSMIESPVVRDMAIWIVPLVMGVLSLVLLIACANVAMLLLSRSAARQQEIKIRLSLGATRSRLLQMLLTETLLFAAMAVPASFYIASMIPVLIRKRVPTMPYYPLDVDASAFTYLAAITVLAGVLAGVAPAIESLGASRRRRSHQVLVAGQVALSFVLVAASTVFVRAELRLLTPDGDYDASRVLIVAPRVSMPPHTPASAGSFYEAFLARVRAIPGVRLAAYSSIAGMDETAPDTATLMGETTGVLTTASVAQVSVDYFAIVGMPIVRGTVFDGRGIVVSESLARTLWPDRDPIGQFADMDANRERPLQVVGVVRDNETTGSNTAGKRVLYRARTSDSRGALLVRFDGDERATSSAIRDAMVALDPFAVSEPRTLSSLREERASRFLRIVTMVMTVGLLGILLAMIGIYGVVAFAAGRREREFGVRVALGATKSDIVRLILSSGSKPVVVGLGAGMVIALGAAEALNRVIGRMPVPLEVHAPVVYVAVAGGVTAVAMAAMFGPALRAASRDPAHALRQE